MTPRKGAHHIVPIAKLVLKERPQAKFAVVGDGDYLDTLRKEVALYKLQDSFIIKGKVPNKQIQEEFYNADIYMMPSQEEGFPRTLLESMACGTPFVAFDVGGVRDIVCSFNQDQIVNVDDIGLFAQKILDLIGMEDESRLGIIKANYEWVQQYGQQKVIIQFLVILQN